MDFDTVTGPDWAASYLTNGDASGLDDGDRAKIDDWLEREGIAEVIDVARDEDGDAVEPRFTWHYRLHFPQANCDGGSVLEYVVRLRE